MLRERVRSFIRRTGYSVEDFGYLKSCYQSGFTSASLLKSLALTRVDVGLQHREAELLLNTSYLMIMIECLSLELSKRQGSSSTLSSCLNEVVTSVEYELRRHYSSLPLPSTFTRE